MRRLIGSLALLTALAPFAAAPLLTAAAPPPAVGTPTVGTPVGTVAITPDTGTLRLGDTLALSTTVHDTKGRLLATAAVTWGLNNPDVARVVAHTLGRATLTANALGIVTVDATSRGVTGYATFRIVLPSPIADGPTPPAPVVTPQPPPGPSLVMAVAPTSMTLAQGTSAGVSVLVRRTGWTGAVTVAASGLPIGVSAAPLTLNGVDSTGALALIASNGAAVGTVTATLTASGAASGAAVADATATVGVTVTLGTVAPPPPPLIGAAVLPQDSVDVSWPTLGGHVITVGAGANLQTALNTAQPGDSIVLAAGATFVGNFTLPAKSCAGAMIVVTSSGTLPARGTRVQLADSVQMARIRTPNSAPAIATAAGACNWRLVGLDVGAQPTVTMVYGIMHLGDGSTAQTSLAQAGGPLVLDRMYVHGHPTLDVRRCIALNSGRTAIVESHIEKCHSNNGDSQAIYGWNGPGPFRIENNYLEAGHEIAGFGGPTPAISGLVPSDIIVRHNHFARPLAWKGVWKVKNFWECKSCQRVLIEGNVMENNWIDAQNGFGILLQGLSDNNTAPWNRIADVTFRNNLVRNTPSGINLASRLAYNGGSLPVNPAARLTFTNNVIALNASLSGAGKSLQVLSDIYDLTVSRNSFIDLNNASLNTEILFDQVAGTGPTVRLALTSNVWSAASYPIIGNGTANPNTTLAKYAPDGVVTGNAFTGFSASSGTFPLGNTFPTPLTSIMSGILSGTYTVSSAIGADWAAVLAATSGVVQETPVP